MCHAQQALKKNKCNHGASTPTSVILPCAWFHEKGGAMIRIGLLCFALSGVALSCHATEVTQADLATPPGLSNNAFAQRFGPCDPAVLNAQGLPLWRRDEYGQVIQCSRVNYNNFGGTPPHHWAVNGAARGTICGMMLSVSETVACRSSRAIQSHSHGQGVVNLGPTTSYNFGLAK